MQAFLRRPAVRNLTALAGIQGGNALIPLLIVPFSLSMVGATVYAKVAIAEALSAFALAAVLFSFDVDGVARVAKLGRDADNAALAHVVSAVISARLVVFAVVAPMFLLGYWLAGGRDGVVFLALWLLVPLGHVFHSYWFYQATEHNAPAALITLASRVATVAIVVLFVRNPKDAMIIPLAIGAPFLLGGLFSTIYIVRSLAAPLRWVGFGTVFADLRRGKEIFAGNVAVALYREANVVILGIVGVPAASISTYALVEKSVKMFQACTRPLNQLFFPKVVKALADKSAPDPSAAGLIARYTWPQIAAVSALIAGVVAAYAVGSVALPALRELIELPDLKIMAAIMAPSMLLGLANFMYGTAGLNTLNSRGYYFLAILATGVFSVGSCFGLTGRFGAIGAAICFLLAEAALLVLVLARYTGKRFILGNPNNQAR